MKILLKDDSVGQNVDNFSCFKTAASLNVVFGFDFSLDRGFDMYLLCGVS